MLEPLSEPIRKLLLELKICSESDLRRCRRHVRRLTYDLPVFDSVWLDALVQIGRLTHFQARILESSDPGRLRIGPCVAIDRLGEGPESLTLLARTCEGGESCVTKILRPPEPLSEETVERLQALVQRVKDLEHPSVVAPFSCVRVENHVVLVSRYVPGSHLGDLLVRRGRFPAHVVWEIGRQLAEGLEELSRRGVAHGDIRAATVRLTPAGTAVLVDTGIRPAFHPALTVHAGLTPEGCDAIAPELIGGGVAANSLSDAYALGCLLWQLLAGRPPFPGGDPLSKLAAHQTRTIDDVRKWAPDTPPALAEMIRRLTARDPADRPAQFAELREAWHAPGRSGRTKLAAFRRRFDSPARVPRSSRPLSTPTRWLLVATTLFALSGGLVMLADKGARNVVLAWASQVAQGLPDDEVRREEGKLRRSTGESATATSAVHDNDAVGRALPAPDRHGVIRLDGPGPWRASDITAVGALTIEGDPAARPLIVIDSRSFRIWAESVKLKNLRISLAAGRSPDSPKLSALLLVHAQTIGLDGCIVESGPIGESAESSHAGPPTAPPSGPALIAWKLLDSADQRGGTATIRNTRFAGDGPALYLAQAMPRVDFDNVLKLGPGPLVQLSGALTAKSPVEMRLAHTTLRSSGALLRWVVPAEDRRTGRILVEAGDCVFDVASPRAALFEFAGPEPRPEWLQSVKMTGEGSIARPTLDVAAWISTVNGRLASLDAAALELEGIISGPFQFAGEPGPNPSAAEVHDSEAPRRTSDPPGIRASDLPQ